MSAERHIYKRGSTPTLSNVLQHVFTVELLRPSDVLWLVSPWISDLEVVDNSNYGFQHIAPKWPLGGVRLSMVLATLLEHQVTIRVVTRPLPPAYRRQESHKVTQRFLQELDRQAPPDAKLHIRRELDDVYEHSKGLLTDHLFLHGSMNFTFHGVNINGEHVRLTSDPEEISSAFVAFADRWEAPVI